ncbi:MAG: CBS domain-containing protein [Saprospiraceae bacterium]|jgi:CBS domain-containing protein
MNLQDPISSIMSTAVKTLAPEDKLQRVKEVFDDHAIHHIPILKEEELVGILSKLDYLYFLKPIHPDSQEQYLNDIRLKNYTVDEVMTKRVISVSSTDMIQTALEVLSENLFHAIPIVDNDKLVGIITTHDIIFRLLHPKRMLA